MNLNGIDATANGKTLIAVQTAGGKLYRIDPATGVAKLIVLAKAESVPNGDGILLDGKTLYVVQNQLNRVAVIRLKPDLARGRVLTRLENSEFKVPTTIDDLGRRLYAVNARFGESNPDTLEYTGRAAEEEALVSDPLREAAHLLPPAVSYRGRGITTRRAFDHSSLHGSFGVQPASMATVETLT